MPPTPDAPAAAAVPSPASGMARPSLARGAVAAAPLLLLLALRPWNFRVPASSYLPLHTLIEIVVAAIGLATFGVQWFAAGAAGARDARARLIAPAFLSASLLEIVHLLVFPGMPGFFGPATPERGIRYWLLARAWTVGGLLAALAVARASESALLRRGTLLALNLAGVAIVIAAELAVGPERAFFFVDGPGLTRLKLALEAVVLGCAAAGSLVAMRRLRATGDGAYGRLASALALTVLSELCFMLYVDPFDPFNVLGHLYLAVTFWFVFQALFVSVLVRPYRELQALRAHVEDELEVKIVELKHANEQREDLLRAVSHDLRNPLQIVLLQAQRLVRGANDERVRFGEAILAAGRRMDRMLRDLVDSARLESGALELQCRPVALRPLVEDLLAHTEGVLEVRRVENRVAPDLPTLHADPDRLERVFVNLVGNGLKYTRDAVVITAEAAGDEVRISVADRGPGIDDTDLPRIFERYYRGQRGAGEGLGLGLYIVRRIVEAHGGGITVASAPGEGSTFTFTLPVAAEPAARAP
jgi:signal transduction histidine kinase